MAAAAVKVLVPRYWFQALEQVPFATILAVVVLAVLLSLCSEADAFIAASLTHTSLTAQLVFLVVGPMVDLKLIAMQTGTWGGRFARRFVPLTLLVAIAAGCFIGFLFFGSL
ncbi:permease [Arcanobacterium hippocoleae]